MHSLDELKDYLVKKFGSQEELLKGLLSLMVNVPGAVYRGLRDWTLTFVSPDIESITGYTPDELLSGPVYWRDLIHRDDLDRVKEMFREAVRKRKGVLMVLQNR
jgi:PAS domain S-box-containing protein